MAWNQFASTLHWRAKKSTCAKYAATYCTEHLARTQGDVSCDKPQEPECLWDLDCMPHHFCSDEGSCVAEPSCTVWSYSSSGFGGSKTTYGPYYYADTPTGRVVDTPDNKHIDSVKISGGCEEVVLRDADHGGCLANRDDNILLENRNSNEEKSNGNLPYDLEHDVCAIFIKIKKNWA